ncbi:Uma2 family endonuclease [Hymenobacter endophyticus]|uniref:Uma2 family endonuclease n=1 Tax=Hymenobacter endophyticus TaxID=3076335 RepID=A0ABU3THG2_9BACT|nr:Uma2 family endonuclease [Hymenobacter endophyticus]MDU0370680.1 Uma2 family endonuclease [Hymenobacter endophyticus]
MGPPATPLAHVSPEDYLAAERRAESKHEYWDGEIRAMSGASFAHNRIAANLTIEIGIQLKGKPCSLVGSDQRVQVLSESTFVYPDLTVVCGQPLFEDNTKPDTLLNPMLLVEVLSASTKSHGRGDKFFLYRQIPTLQQYLLLDSQRVHAELHTQDAQGRWLLTETTNWHDLLMLDSIGCQVPLTDVYAGLMLP